MPPPPRQRAPRKITDKYLHNAALHYLERYATSAENLRRVLQRRVIKSAAYHGTSVTDGEQLIDALIRRFVESGLLDDAVYAAMRATSLNRLGNSQRLIRQKLRQKGVGTEATEAALESLQRDQPDPDLKAAIRLARRRRLGPYRTSGDRTDRREKDLAALARAGFSYDMARRVIDAERPEDLEEESLD